MITTYFSMPGNAREAANFYARAFDAPPPELMTYDQMPQKDQDEMGGAPADFIVHANVATFAGNLMLSDGGEEQGPGKVSVCVDDPDEVKIRAAFDRLSEGGTVQMPLAPAFFSPLFGTLTDKYGITWMLMMG